MPAEYSVAVTYTMNAQKKGRHRKTLDGVVKVKLTEGGKRGSFQLLDDFEDPVVPEPTILTSKHLEELEAMGWIAGQRAVENDGREVIWKLGENMAIFLQTKPVEDTRPPQPEREVRVPKKKAAQRPPMKKYQCPLRKNSAMRLPLVPLDHRQPTQPQQSSALTVSKRRRSDDGWDDDGLFGQSLEQHDLANSTPSSTASRVSSPGGIRNESAHAVDLARGEVGARRTLSDADALTEAVKRTARRAPIVAERSKATRGSMPNNALSVVDGTECEEPVEDGTAEEKAERWLMERTRNVDVAYNACWQPTKEQLSAVIQAGKATFAASVAPGEESTEPLRKLLHANLRLDTLPRKARNDTIELVDLCLDPTLFSYRYARKVVDNDKDVDYDRIQRVLDAVQPASLVSPEILARTKAHFTQARNGSIVALLRARERPDEQMTKIPQEAPAEALLTTFQLPESPSVPIMVDINAA